MVWARLSPDLFLYSHIQPQQLPAVIECHLNCIANQFSRENHLCVCMLAVVPLWAVVDCDWCGPRYTANMPRVPITTGLPRWPGGLGHCHWLLDALTSGAALMAVWFKALSPTARHPSPLGPALMAVWSKALPPTSRRPSPLSACPDGCVV